MNTERLFELMTDLTEDKGVFPIYSVWKLEDGSWMAGVKSIPATFQVVDDIAIAQYVDAGQIPPEFGWSEVEGFAGGINAVGDDVQGAIDNLCADLESVLAKKVE